MRTCPFCKEDIRDDAIKCRYCQSLLVSLTPASNTDDGRVTYVLDRDLIRFAKFSGAVVSVLVLIGLILYGIDLKHMHDELSKGVEEMKSTLASTKDYSDQTKVSLAANKQYSEEAKTSLATNHQYSEESKASLAASKGYADKVKATHDSTLSIANQIKSDLNQIEADKETSKAGATYIAEKVTFVQKSLSESASTKQESVQNESQTASQENSYHLYSIEEVTMLVNADVDKANAFFRSQGFKPPKYPVHVLSGKDDIANAYWAGPTEGLYFGMEMVNSNFFGPYDPTLTFHEATHSLVNVTFSEQSGAVNESICDVMAVVINGIGWTVGSVKSGDPSRPMHLRSLMSPGSAYNTKELGKDPQVSHMDDYDHTSADLGGIHINVGILNKAAYLISEGGEFRGVTVSRGIGRANLGRLYVKVIQLLPKGTVDFKQFRRIVIAAARAQFGEGSSEVHTVEDGFRAVGIT